MHNGFFFKYHADMRKRLPGECDDSAGSLVAFNLGYAIDPRDMRRGDMVGIDWKSGGGHATFCWDVHLNAAGEVDCFLYLSSNGSGGKGVGVSVGTLQPARFVKQEDGRYKKQKDPLFADSPDYIRYGAWMCIPQVKAKDVDLKSFKGTPPSFVTGWAAHLHAINRLRVVRLWGVGPPTRPQAGSKYAQSFELARKLAAEDPPESYATGTGAPVTVHVKDVPVTKIPATEVQTPDAVKKVPPKPVQQKKEHVVDHQLFVEQALHELHGAGWIAKDPGKVDAVYDAATKAAVEDFQTQFKVEPIDGKPGAITRAALKRVLDDLHAGKPNPNKPEEHRPRVDHFYWLRNRVLPGGSNKLAIHGANLDTLVTLKITLTDENGARERLSLPRIPEADRAVFPLTIPATLARGAKLTARLEGSGKDGTTIDKSSKVPLYLEAPI